MIPVSPAPEPTNFDILVRRPGLRAIAEMVGKTPRYPRASGSPFRKIATAESEIPATVFPPYWTRALDELMSAYGEICAYSCFRIHPVTGARSVDHFAPRSRSWQHVYEWKNYRLACSRMNARKIDFSGVLDPFKIKASWFRLELVGFQVCPGFGLPRALRMAIQGTIDRLGLAAFCRDRANDAEDYWSGHISLKILRRESPFVARELHRQNRLRPGDVW